MYHKHLRSIYLRISIFRIKIIESPYNTVVFIQKTILGGILIFTIQLNAPFFITKLHVVECNRLQSTNSRASINQVTVLKS